jgi:ribosome biogenesis GTPase A
MLSRFHILRRGFTNTAVCLKKRVVRPNPTSHRGPVVERPLPLKIIENRDLARKGISSSLESLDIYFPLQPKPTPLELREARRFTKLEERIKPIASTLDYQCLGERDVPEVAFLGRGNVGKSTIINALTGKRIAQPTKKAVSDHYHLNE